MPVAVFTVGCLFRVDKFGWSKMGNMLLVALGVAIASFGESQPPPHTHKHAPYIVTTSLKPIGASHRQPVLHSCPWDSIAAARLADERCPKLWAGKPCWRAVDCRRCACWNGRGRDGRQLLLLHM